MATTQTEAVVNYLVPGVEKPVYVASEAGADAALNISARFEPRRVAVADARELDPPPGLDREGFALVPHETAIADFYDLAGVRAAYERELVALVCDAAGAADATVFDHTLRGSSSEVRGARQTREPASVIHNDYTDASALRRLRDILSPEEAKRREQGRWAIINVWRSIAGPVQRSPLALCDARSLEGEELVASERRARERVGELELVTYRPGHRWFYFPRMHRGEVLLIKTFDSARDGPARCAVHTAFDDPATPADAPPRESIESRLLVFFR